MKKILLLFVFINFISASSFARVPLDQCFNFYQNTKDEYKHISPAWAEIMLQSGHLKGIRLFGDFGSIEHQDFKPHPAFTDKEDRLNYNAPQDAISALLQYLFPSTNGQVLAINQRQNDPLGQLRKKTKLPLLSSLIETIVVYKKDKNKQKLQTKIIELIENTRGKNDKSKKTRSKFDSIQHDFTDILMKAIEFEDTPDYLEKYPANTIINALFAFALTSADHAIEIYECFKWVFVNNPNLQIMTKENYETLVTDILTDPKFDNGVDEEKLIRTLLGNAFFEQRLPAPLSYINASFLYQNKKIIYPNCGETTLLNFFYYLWGDRGIINPNYIEETEKKLQYNIIDINKNENWTKIKKYFTEFNTINLSMKQDAQQKWSNLISNLNQNDTDPSLKIIYRQEVCNVMGAGIFNMLNVLEKIIPDDLLSKTFSDDETKALEEAALKFDRLVTLFSRENDTLDWHINSQKIISNKITNIVFSVNKEEWFTWQFKNNSFGLERILTKNNDWRKKIFWEKAPSLLKAWVRAETQNLCHDIEHPSEIYALDLLSPKFAGIAIDTILDNKWIQLKSLIPQLVGKTLYAADMEAQIKLYLLLHLYNGNINGNYYTELDYNTYITNKELLEALKELSENQAISACAQRNFWKLIQKNYNVEDSRNAQAHLIAAQHGYLPIIRWILEHNPEAKNDKDKNGYDLTQIAIQNNQLDVLDYLNPQSDYRTTNGQTLLHLYASSPYDMTDYINKVLENNLDLINVVDAKNSTILHSINYFTHINNVKIIIDTIINNNFSFDQENNDSITPLIHLMKYATDEAVLYFLKKNIPTHFIDEDGKNLLHYLSEKSKTESALFLIEEKGFNIQQITKKNETPLHFAAKSNASSLIRYFIAKGAEINAEDENGMTPLHLLLSNDFLTINDFETIKYMLDNGANLHISTKSAPAPFYTMIKNSGFPANLMEKIIESYKSILKYIPTIFASIPKEGNRKLTLFSSFGVPNFTMIESETTIDYVAPNDVLHIICLRYPSKIVDMFINKLGYPIDIKDEFGQTPLHIATKVLNLETVDYLLSKNADPYEKDNQGNAPLHLLSEMRDHFERKNLILECYIKHHVDLNKKNNRGKTPLMIALPTLQCEESEKFVTLLLDNNTDLSITDEYGNTLIHYLFDESIAYFDSSTSFLSNMLEMQTKLNPSLSLLTAMFTKSDSDYDPTPILNKLIENGVNFEARNKEGQTPLLRAFTNFNSNKTFLKNVEILLKLGASIHANDDNGNTILHNLICVSDYYLKNKLNYVQRYVEQYNLDVTLKNKNGHEALNYVSDPNLAKYLISKGANSNIVFRGKTWTERLSL
ncbi:MAG: ankyrin repeat domain-containing protein [Alphaproteobacteria bacterium]|nr:ankyrin repeat domain-containing protein [Alphaproteobacteria bacterium]